MKRYGKYSPTQFDDAGAFLPDRSDWFVLSVSQTRDSGPLDQSNFATAQQILTDGREEPEDFEVHRFGHWGPGWFELILIRPGTRAEELARGIESRMESYPVLDEEDYCAREWEDFVTSWEAYAARELVKELAETFGLSDRAEELLDENRDALRDWWMEHAREPYFGESSGVCIPVKREVERMERAEVASLLRSLRSPNHNGARGTSPRPSTQPQEENES